MPTHANTLTIRILPKSNFAGNFCYNFYFLHIVLTNYAHCVKKRNNTKVC